MNSVRLVCSRSYYDNNLKRTIKQGTMILADKDRARILFESKVCDIVGIDSLPRYDYSRKTVCVYYSYIYRTGGAEMASYTLIKYLSNYYNVICAMIS